MNKIFFLYFIIAKINAQLIGEWQKVDSGTSPRYFLKNSQIPICGILDPVDVTDVTKKEKSFVVNSCFKTKHDEIVYIEVIEVKNEVLIFKKMKRITEFDSDSNQTYFSYEKDVKGVIYEAPARLLTSLWGVRFRNGELMLNLGVPCQPSYVGGTKQNYLQRMLLVPFETSNEKSEKVRYHFFKKSDCPQEE